MITLIGEFTDLNTYVNAERSNRFIGAKIKRENNDNVLRQLTLKEVVTEYPVRMTYKWFTKDLRKDPSNVAFAIKYIEDALVTKGILRNDTRKEICEICHKFDLDKNNPRVEITIEHVPVLT